MNRFDIGLPNRSGRAVAWIASASVLATALSGCGAGQLAQTTSQVPAVNGVSVTFNNVALRDVRIQAVQSGDYLRAGQTVPLMLVAVNQSPDITDRLVGISSDIGKVTVTGDPRLPASGLLFVDTRHGQSLTALDAVENATRANATITLTKPITNGLTYNLTFDFEKAGKGSVLVPVSAADTPATLVEDAHPAGGHE